MEGWLIRQEMEKEDRRKDWILSEVTLHQRPQKRMKQMSLETPILVKKAGKKRSSAENSKAKKSKFNKRRK